VYPWLHRCLYTEHPQLWAAPAVHMQPCAPFLSSCAPFLASCAPFPSTCASSRSSLQSMYFLSHYCSRARWGTWGPSPVQCSLCFSWPGIYTVHMSLICVPCSLLLPLQSMYFLSHYLFASQTGHVGALYSAFLAMQLAAGLPGLVATLALCINTNLFGSITHYSSGQAAASTTEVLYCTYCTVQYVS